MKKVNTSIYDTVGLMGEQKDYERKLKYFKDNNWQYFVNIEKENIQNKIKELETTLLNTNDKEEKQKLNQALKNLKKENQLKYKLIMWKEDQKKSF